MRVITPDGNSDGVLTPDSYPDSGGVAGSYRLAFTATGNGSAGPVEIGPLPETGPYLMTVCLIASNPVAMASGDLDATLTVNGAPAFTPNVSLTLANTAIASVEFAVTSLSVTVDWAITNFVGTSVDVKIVASAIKLF